jgi:hypothetical protein
MGLTGNMNETYDDQIHTYIMLPLLLDISHIVFGTENKDHTWRKKLHQIWVRLPLQLMLENGGVFVRYEKVIKS